jgi:hypothetical protein
VCVRKISFKYPDLYAIVILWTYLQLSFLQEKIVFFLYFVLDYDKKGHNKIIWVKI